MAHTNSKTWTSAEIAEKERWENVDKGMKRMRFDRSPFFPKTLDEWLVHRADYTAQQAESEKHRLAQRSQAGPAIKRHTVRLPLGGKAFNDNRSLVLSYCSVWSPGFGTAGGGDVAPWPAPHEFREEGDERHTSGFRRFLPVPRVPGNETVLWKQRAFMQPSPIDVVFPVPTTEWNHELGSPLDCRPSTSMFFYGPFALGESDWTFHYDTFSIFETVHWVERAESIVRYLHDEAAMNPTIRSRPETASLPSIQEEGGGDID